MLGAAGVHLDKRLAERHAEGRQHRVAALDRLHHARDTVPDDDTRLVQSLVLETDDLDTDVAALTARGVRIEDGIQEQPWGRFVTFDDPDGNGVVLQATSPSV